LKVAGANKRPGINLYAGISSNVVDESVEFARYCADQGVDAVVATVPFYYTLTESQMKKYFDTLASAIPLPLIIYNIPATTHISIPLSLIEELSHHPNIVATKDSERSVERLKQSLSLWKNREDFAHFTGWASMSAEALINGSDGLVPSTGNLFPEIYSAMLKSVEEGNSGRLYELQKFSDLYGNLYQEGRTLGESLSALKVLMNEKGLCGKTMMPPLQQLTAEEENVLVQTLRNQVPIFLTV
jgi:dihydrodipicolinate synthase/N-acetylneuraminate lyase